MDKVAKIVFMNLQSESCKFIPEICTGKCQSCQVSKKLVGNFGTISNEDP